MNEKLLENSGLDDVLAPQDSAKPDYSGRTLALPPGLTLDDLEKLSPDQLNKKIQEVGPAVGYAALLKMAAGLGGVAAGVQFHAAKFMAEVGETLKDKDAAAASNGDLIKGLKREELVALVKILEALRGGQTIDLATLAGPSNPLSKQIQ